MAQILKRAINAEKDSKQQRNKTKKTAGSSQRPQNQAVKIEYIPWTSTLTIHPGESARHQYQTAPHKRFPSDVLRSVMNNIVEARLTSVEYTSNCSVIARELSDSIKEAAKNLSYERYKLISYVAIGQLRDSDVICSSRGVWCQTADTFTEYIFKNDQLFALCILFAVYQE
ncbi:dynein light chain Tctex-type 5-B [Hoplias malabaricus]|uniref:dynein light chain Tctex-type 5-B n=1 Tax=Hoplias malabaricus TaxID=27720 RepID=UPI003462087B